MHTNWFHVNKEERKEKDQEGHCGGQFWMEIGDGDKQTSSRTMSIHLGSWLVPSSLSSGRGV